VEKRINLHLIPRPLLLKEKRSFRNEFPLLQERARVRWRKRINLHLIPRPLLLKEKGSFRNEFPLLQERARVRWRTP
jgi:hypothetical protein